MPPSDRSVPAGSQLLAYAKVNLCLHVGGTRPDGLHDIFTLSLFPSLGDIVSAEPADALTLAIDGPFAGRLAGLDARDNLMMRAAGALQAATGCARGARLTLTKNVPPASGIGGGTADAAATLVLLRDMWELEISDRALIELSFTLGADGPLCLAPHLFGTRSAIATGAGETVRPGPALPPLWVCLVNPMQAVSTAQIFRRFDADLPTGPADHLATASSYASHTALGAMLAATRNDLSGPAMALCPAISTVIEYLAGQPGCFLARMSGSGATCFGLFSSREAGLRAARAARARGWWADASVVEPATGTW